MVLFLKLLVSCSSDPTALPEDKSPLKPSENQNRIRLDLETELAMGNEYPLMKKDIFSLFDLFINHFVEANHFEQDGEMVFETRVKYRALNKLREEKDLGFLKLVGSIEGKIREKDFLSERSIPYQMSFWINLYNYAAIRLINKNFKNNPKKRPLSSIRELGTEDQGMDIFQQEIIEVEEVWLSLNEILEKKILPLCKHNDARILFLLSPSTLSGFPIPYYAINPENIESALEEFSKNALKMKKYLEVNHEHKNLGVAQMFGWYKEVFNRDRNGGVNGFIQKVTNEALPLGYELIYLPYNWELNSSNSRDLPRIVDLEQLPNSRPVSNDSGDQDDDQDNPGDPPGPQVNRMQACRIYQNNPMMDIIARCELVIEADNGSSSRSIEKVDLCLIEQELMETEGKIRTIAGKIWDRKRKNSDDPLNLRNIFLSSASKDEGFSFKIKTKNKYKSTLQYDAGQAVLKFEQKVRFIGRTLHSARFKCNAFY